MKSQTSVQPLLLALILSLGILAAWVAGLLALYPLFLSNALDLDSATTPGAMVDAVIVPAPIPFAFAQCVLNPVVNSSNSGNLTFPRYSFENMAKVSASPFAVIVAISLCLTIWCYRRHGLYSEYGALAWAIFVFLFGAPGLIGYLLHRHWPVTEKCQHCGKITPLDRGACLHCGTEFPLPALKGIEVFA
jgi:hypothetical protein